MKNQIKHSTSDKLRDILGENKWKELVKKIEGWLTDITDKNIKFDWKSLRIEYKRDQQDAVNTAITANIEEKSKEIICPRIPKWIGPDHLTLIGLLAVVLTAVGYILGFFNREWLILVPLGLVLNWFGDSFDGSIARYRKKTRPNYGYYIDKIIDAVVVMIFALGIGLSGFVKIEIALLLACAYFSLMLHVDLVVYVQNKAQTSFGPLGPTEVRIIGIILTVIMYFIPVHYYDFYGHWLTQYDFSIFGLSVIMFIVLFVSIARKGLELHKEDTKDW